MLKKLLIPAFVFTVAVVGCSSSSTPSSDGGAGKTGTAGSTAGTTGSAGSTAGTTGTAGATAGTTGTAGATAGTTGTAGATAGTTGTAGSDGGAVAGHDGGTAGSDGGGAAGSDGGGVAGSDGGGAAGSDGGTAIPTCTSTTGESAAMSAENFCKIFLATCGTATTGYTTTAECMTAYTASVAKPNLHMCVSYHLCNAVANTGTMRTTHCGHASSPGTAPCAQTN
jgi:hypothetical protein